VTVADGASRRCAARQPEPTWSSTGAAPAIAGFIYGGVPLSVLEAEGALSVTGDRALAERFAALFPLPAKAVMPARA
jgi:hypothetical protein